MKELSLNILDITKNSLKAGSTFTKINITETEQLLTLTITDNGCGITDDILKSVLDPFCTTRTTRKVGMGLPLLKLQAEQTGGKVTITSKHIDKFPNQHGTTVKAEFFKKHIDFVPLGNVISTVITLIQGNPNSDFLYTHNIDGYLVTLDTRVLRETLEDVPLNTYEVIKWIEEYLIEQYSSIPKA